jgi:hypothetical protein
MLTSQRCRGEGNMPVVLIGFLIVLLTGSTADAGNGVDSPYVPSGYKLVFSDEFRTPDLDTTKWWTRYIYSGGTLDHLNDEAEHYRESNNHVFNNWTMRLNAYYLADGTLSSGMVRSKMTFLGGYFEARLKLPRGLGTWAAFWLNSAARTSDGRIAWPPEIDIMEAMHSECCEQPWMWHTGGAARTPPFYQDNSILATSDSRCVITTSTTGLCKDDNFDETQSYYYNWNAAGTGPEFLYNDFHILGLLWQVTDYAKQTGLITTYFDGKPIVERHYNWVYDDNTPAGYAHLLLNQAMGGACCGGPIDNLGLPEGMEIDYVRVYQDPTHRVTGVDTVGVDLCPTGGGC